MQAELDLADRRILFELDCNSRQSLSELARKVHLGRDLVSYRIERLQNSGLVNRFSLMINPYKLGLTVYKTYLKLETNRTRVAELVAALNTHRSTYWVAETYGEWDLIFSILARTPKEFYDFQDHILSDFNDIVLNFNVYTLVNYWWFPKKYMLGQRWQNYRNEAEACSIKSARALNGWSFKTPEFTFGTTPDQVTLDQLEYKLVDLLSKNARLSYAELSQQVGSTPSVVKYRLEKLESLGVIAGYRVDIDRSLLGMNLFKVMVHLRDYDVKNELQFREFCRQHPHISCYVQQIGAHKVEFECEAKDYAEFNAVVDEVRERFSKYIRSMDYMVIRKDYHHRTPCNVFATQYANQSTELLQQAV